MHKPPRQLIDRPAEAHRSWFGCLLETCRDIDRCTKGILHSKRAHPAMPQNYLAKMYTNSDLDLFRRLQRHAVSNCQARQASSNCMVFNCRGRPEDGHDPVASPVADHSFKAFYFLNHRPNGRVENIRNGFGMEMLDKLCRSLNVRKQDRNPPELSFDLPCGFW